MRLNTLALVAVLGAAALAVGACRGGGASKPCVEDMPGMIMCSYGVPVPASPATHAPSVARPEGRAP